MTVIINSFQLVQNIQDHWLTSMTFNYVIIHLISIPHVYSPLFTIVWQIVAITSYDYILSLHYFQFEDLLRFLYS